jgi:hypothetical protein
MLAASLAFVVGSAGCDGASTPGVAGTGPKAGASAGAGRSGPRTLTIVGSGDVLLHPDLWRQAQHDAQAAGETGYDFAPLFGGVRDIISGADLAICHLETPLGPPAGPFTGYPQFSVPPQIAPALAEIGYDTCSTASNHTLDEGEAGIARTLDALDAAGIRHAGSYRTQHDHDTVNLLTVHGVLVAQLSYSFGFNGLTRPAGKPWVANLIDPAAILEEAHRARAAGAKIVVVSIHWGTEYQHDPNQQQLSVARTLLASPDVDLILGCHAHVVQPFEKINGKWVVYGMGNEVAHHSDPINDNREGVLPRFTFTEDATGGWRVTTVEAIPVWMDLSPNNRLVDIPKALADPHTSPAEHTVLQAAWQRIRGYLGSRGADRDGLSIPGS